MDWYVDCREPDALSALRRELGDYLARHAAAGSDLDGARLAVSELVGNVARHTPGPAWVHVDWSASRAVVEVHDLGSGFTPDATPPADPLAESGRGLWIVHRLTDELEVAAKRAGGSRVRVTLPVRRATERSQDPRPASVSPLPALEEADETGAFGKEPFLRALVVQLAQAVEARQGPDAVETAVAEVGTEVGGQMEKAYRAARGLTERLTPREIADLYVRLKAAIDGDFYVIEASDERIVLGNRACPFGDVVRRSPGLCQMTSSVFGGIAARSAGRASVVLEERIAVGDPECRIVVTLGEHPPSAAARHYRAV